MLILLYFSSQFSVLFCVKMFIFFQVLVVSITLDNLFSRIGRTQRLVALRTPVGSLDDSSIQTPLLPLNTSTRSKTEQPFDQYLIRLFNLNRKIFQERHRKTFRGTLHKWTPTFWNLPPYSKTIPIHYQRISKVWFIDIPSVNSQHVMVTPFTIVQHLTVYEYPLF